MSKTFQQLGLRPELVQALHDSGITAPFAIQALTIGDAMAGRDVCGKAQTGSGKTLAFGLPAIERITEGAPGHPTGLVMAPTRELATQIHDVLAPFGAVMGKTVRAIYGGTDVDKDVNALKKRIDLVVATPGRLIDLYERKAIEFDKLEVVVLDEADRMVDMGFLPQVEWVLRKIKHPHQTLLFSATLDGAIDSVRRHYQTDPVEHEVMASTQTVSQMVHHFLQVHDMDKSKVAASIINNVDRTLLFVRTKRMADRLTEDLIKQGVKAAGIHGDLRQNARERSLSDFSDGTLSALVATDVAARGIHVEGIDVVVHYDVPEDHKSYLHRSGRTARAGKTGVVVTLAAWNQIMEIERLQKRLGLRQPIIEVFSNDDRLKDLTSWNSAV